ncbi:MAG: hypothetical protein LUD83_08205 [Clostridiales bacterium]|nr:hypothetical protein [Clostridiales bacterium]
MNTDKLYAETLASEYAPKDTSKAISFASALISMLSLEIAMLLQFGTDEAFFRTMTVSTGTGFCVMLSATALYMILTAQRALRTQDSLK